MRPVPRTRPVVPPERQGIKEALFRVFFPDARAHCKAELQQLAIMTLDLTRRVSEPAGQVPR